MRKAYSEERRENFREAFVNFGIVKELEPFNSNNNLGYDRCRKILKGEDNFDFEKIRDVIK